MGVTTPPPQLAPPILSKPSGSNKNYYSTSSSHNLEQSFPCNNYYYNNNNINNPSKPTNNCQYSMSQDYHHHHQANIFSFSNGFGRSQQEHLAQQIRRDKLRGGGYDHSQQPPPPLVGIGGEGGEDPEDHQEGQPGGGLPVYETAGMLSEMFNFPPPPGTATAGDLMDPAAIALHNYRTTMTRQQQAVSDWYTNRQQQQQQGGSLAASGLMGPLTNDQSSKSDPIHGINADSAAAMQLFLMNPHQHQQPRSPSPAPSPSNNASSTLHMLLPNPSGNNSLQFNPGAGVGVGVGGEGEDGGASPFGGPPQFTWVHDTEAKAATGMESQGLSLSLSSHLEAAKAEEFRLGGGGGDHGGFLYGTPGGGAAASSSSGSHHQFYKGLGLSQHQHQHHQALHLQGTSMGHQIPPHHQGIHHHLGFGVGAATTGGGSIVNNSSSSASSSLGVVNVLRSSKYVKAAQELLEEFCSVGRGQLKRNKLMGRGNANPSSSTNNNSSSKNNNNNNDNNNPPGNGSSSSTKDIPPLSAADRIEHQRRKVKLLSMLDEVARRYNHYCEQMQMVVNSFDLVMGFGSAVPYTALAQKAMSRHFRCLKDAIAAQLKHSCELLGEKDASGSSGITKGETPRLKMLEQSLRQQRAFHQMGMMEQEAWRPQRGLPERSVNILRAWLFEHFLHPYPSDADKHLLARQTGLSRNQVSNWFINARVRLWKPMVEDMYQQESKDEDSASEEKQTNSITNNNNNNSGLSQTPPPTTATTTASSPPPTSTGSQLNANIENDPSLFAMQARQRFADNHAVSPIPSTNFVATSGITAIMDAVALPFHDLPDDTCQRGGISTADYPGNPSIGNLSHATADAFVRFGTSVATSGDVSLTLGLRHAGNTPDKGSSSPAFTVRDFGGC